MRATVLLFSATLILSAFLLFSVQPMFSKMILPLLGGSPSVWNTAMVFFQAMLLAGYAYAHGTSRRLGMRTQSMLHIAILAGCAFFLPFAIPAGWAPPAEGSPAFWQLGVMAAIVGAPFFIVSASAPMLQRWFAGTDHPDAANPYFLYAASNIGSMAALLSYPFLIEPALTLKAQAMSWTVGYGALAFLTFLCAALVWKKSRAVTGTRHTASEPIPRRMKALWLLLAFIPSSLMLGVTTYITTDIASVPLLWIIPLCLYLLTFILVFSRRPIVKMDYAVSLFTAFFVLTLFFVTSSLFTGRAVLFLLHLVLFFFAALLCHKKLADLRPSADHLTAFYMYMSLGGVLGGMFNALLAPMLFVVPVEYALVLCLALVVRAMCMTEGSILRKPDWSSLKRSHVFLVLGTAALMIYARHTDLKSIYLLVGVLVVITIMSLRLKPRAFALLGAMLLLTHSSLIQLTRPQNKLFERNFYGVLRITDEKQNVRHLFHGTTLHGTQPLIPEYRLVQMSYYNPKGPLGDVFHLTDDNQSPQKIGILGLGAGTLACFSKEGRSFDFYEIDPDIVRIAENRNYFTYLSDCGSPYQVTMGDGRLNLAKAADQSYDLIVMDAFSSDNVPMHLITLDALNIYLKKLKSGGIIAINISNRYLNLEPLIASLSEASGVPAFVKLVAGNTIREETTLKYSTSYYAAFTKDPASADALQKDLGWKPAQKVEGFRVWTDDYANIFTSLSLINPPNSFSEPPEKLVP